MTTGEKWPSSAALEDRSPVARTLHEAVSTFKRRLVEDTLAAHGGNRSRAAVALGIERTSLLRLIRELGIVSASPGRRGRPASPPASDIRRDARGAR